MKNDIENLIREALSSIGVSDGNFIVEHPTDLKMGDYSTNVAIKYRDKKEEIFSYLQNHKPDLIEKVELAGPGFINFYLSKEFFKNSLKEITEKGENFGKGDHAKGFKVMVEYTDPNVMKPFHIGHLMSNVIGESISRVFEWNGAHITRMNYYSDSGLNIAKAVWGIKQKQRELPPESADLSIKAEFLGDSYAHGVREYESNEAVAAEIREINKKIFDRSDKAVTDLYDLGKRWSLEYLSRLYTRLGTGFDLLVAESEISDQGKKLVLEFVKKGVFEESEGAIVFKGEKYNPKLHTRVFINKEGLPTYEAKELGLTKKKFTEYNPDLSVVITANEQNEYFRVVHEAIKQVIPGIGEKTKHFGHGILRLPSGKMSSRTGNVITAEELIDQVKEKVKGDERVAIAAIKYMILRQSIGNDIVFDFEKSVSTEGDSGVYLQYAHARANSILEKADKKGSVEGERVTNHEIEKLLYRFPEVVERAGAEYAPHYITTYLTELAASFNNFYAHEPVLEEGPESQYRLSIVEAFRNVMRNGLTILGIPAPEKM